MTDATSVAETVFDRAVRARHEGDLWVADVDLNWSAPTGPNGGYLAGIVARAIEAQVDPAGERQLRSLSLQYLRTARIGRIELRIDEVRSGRRLTSVRVTARQEGRDVLSGFATLAARGLAIPASWGPPMPDVAPPPALDAESRSLDAYDRRGAHWLELPPGLPPIVQQLKIAPRIGGGPFTGRTIPAGTPIESGGWMRSPEPQRIDAAYLAQLTDFWWPPSFEVLTAPAVVPTIDLTIHVYADLPHGGADPDAVLGVYRTAAAAHGLSEEDATLWRPDGTLLARARQMALFSPVEERPS